MPEFWDWNYGPPMGVFGFIIIVVLINAVASVFRTRAKQDVIREAIKSGHDINPEIIDSFQERENDGGIVPGLILMAVAVGLAFMGHQIETVSQDEQVFDIMLGVASIPFLIGLVLFIAALLGKKSKS